MGINQQESTEIQKSSPTDRAPLIRILIVDDETHIRYVLSRALGGVGYEIHEAEDASSTLAKLRETPHTKRGQEERNGIPVSPTYHLVLMDLQMPGLHGEDLLRILKEDFPKLPVIVITAVANVDTAVTCMKMGAADYILKPFSVPDMLARVKRALQQ